MDAVRSILLLHVADMAEKRHAGALGGLYQWSAVNTLEMEEQNASKQQNGMD